MNADVNQGPGHPFDPVTLRRRIRRAAAVLIAGLALSGLTAIPIEIGLNVTRRLARGVTG